MLKAFKFPQETFTLEDGESRPCQWKAIQFEDKFWWEARRVQATFFGPVPPKQPSKQLVKTTMPAVAKYWQDFGIDECTVVPNRNSRRHTPEEHGEEEVPALDRDEFMMSSHSKVLFLLGHACNTKNRRLTRRIALGALGAFFHQMLPGSILHDIRAELTYQPDRAHGWCSNNDKCRHTLTVEFELSRLEEILWPPQTRLMNLLYLLADGIKGCPLAVPWYRALIARIADIMDDRMHNMVEYDPLQMPMHMIGPGGNKKRRVDQDTREAVTSRVTGEGRAVRAAGWATMNGESENSVRFWRDKDLLVHVGNTWMTFDGSKTISMTMDASRLGEPAKEMLLSGLWSADKAVGRIGHVQDLPLASLEQWCCA